MRLTIAILSSTLLSTTVGAFSLPTTKPAHTTPPSTSTTQLAFGIPSFLTPQSDDDVEENKQQEDNKTKKDEKKISLSGIVQLITAGAGAPFLGNFEGVDEETGKFMFSLEANNLVDEEGRSKQVQAPYFEQGWVDPDDEGFKWPWEK